jgi:hypothetical protein
VADPVLFWWQAQVLSNDAVEGLTRLVWEGPDHPITPAALHAIANLAADNKQAQDALREAGMATALTTQCSCL